MSVIGELGEDSLQELYTWIDEIPLSRPKKNFARDFSDGVLVAEIIKHFIPSIVDLHNYATANSSSLKTDNWNLLSRKVFSRLSFVVEEDHIKGIVMCKPGFIEHVLTKLRENIDSYMTRKKTADAVEKNLIENGSNSLQTNYNYPPAYSDNQAYIPLQHQAYHYQSVEINNKDNEKITSYDVTIAKPKIHHPKISIHVSDEDQSVVSKHVSDKSAADQSQPSGSDVGISIKKQTKKPKKDAKEEDNPKVSKKSNDPYLVNDAQVTSPGSNKSLKQAPPFSINPATQANKVKLKSSKKNDGYLKNNTSDLRVALEEKEQALLASQETIQILHAKIRRLEHLLQLKDLRINELKESSQSQQQPQQPTLIFNQTQSAEHPSAPIGNINYALPPPLHSYPYQQNASHFAGNTSSLPLINNKQPLKEIRGVLQDKDSRFHSSGIKVSQHGARAPSWETLMPEPI